jgi:hypothetical protein
VATIKHTHLFVILGSRLSLCSGLPEDDEGKRAFHATRRDALLGIIPEVSELKGGTKAPRA